LRAGFLRYGETVNAIRDERDREILGLLRTDAWLTYAAIADRVNLSASAVQRRVERLIDAGVLLGARAVVADTQDEVSIYLLAELADDSNQTLRQFTQAIDGASGVREAYYVTGEADVLLKLAVKDMAEYDRFIADHVNGQPIIRRFKTLVALRALA